MNPGKNSLIGCLLLMVFILIGCNSSEESQPVGTPSTSEPSASGPHPVPFETNAPVTMAFGSQIAEIPGTIEAENFDEGEPNVAYADQDEENLGADDHRGPTQVDIEKRDDASGGYGVGWTRKGEWLVYTVNVKATGVYNLEIPVASDKQGGAFHIEFHGEDVSGPIEVPDTGGWGTLQTITKEGLQLKQGVQVMKLVMDSAGLSGSIGDIDCLRFSASPQ